MGVPKFFRWLSERYPLINQRYHAPSAEYEQNLRQKNHATEEEDTESNTKKPHKSSKKSDRNSKNASTNSAPPPQLSDPTDVLGGATLAPEVDRLYIDMNGIIHGCSHNNNEDDGSVTEIAEERIFDNLGKYLDRVVGEIVRPKRLVYMAIDGVAPRAKLNQQRSRRYRSSSGQEIETTVYEAHLNHLATQQSQQSQQELLQQQTKDNDLFQEYESDVGAPLTVSSSNSTSSTRRSNTHHQQQQQQQHSEGQLLTEVEPGRFAGKFETQISGAVSFPSEEDDDTTVTAADDQEAAFHSNAITPGTPFFTRCVDHLETYLRHKLATDPHWKHLTVIFSGPNVPGEGEHKIMDFMRTQRARPGYDPNLRHAIMGQDGDLIMLGLATHEPNLVLFREQVIFDARRRRRVDAIGVDRYVHNPNFEFLHMNVLRDYLAFDFETSNVVADSPFDLERTIDDFVFMTFFVGNDFLPSIPALDIADEAFDLLWYTYREHREKWYEEFQQNGGGGVDPYLTHAGTIVSGKRLEAFLAEVGSYESPYYDNKKESAHETNRKIRSQDRRMGRTETLPSDNVLQAKEEADRARFREMMLEKQEALQAAETGTTDTNFTPVLSSPEPVLFEPSHGRDDEGWEPGLPARLGNLLQKSFSPQQTAGGNTADGTGGGGGGDGDGDGELDHSEEIVLDDQDLKGRYYFDKFQFTPFDKEKHQALRKAYLEGLVWNLKYYYEGVPSWDWYFPYHYGPMLSDLKNIDEMLQEISFEGKLGEPLQPFEQLLSCMPPSQARMLPEPYRWLMTSPSSPLIDYYPKAFTVDMNGKRWPWEAVVLLPFIDTQKLQKYSRRITEEYLSPEEVERNKQGQALVMSHDSVKAAANHHQHPRSGGSLEEDAVRIDPFDHSEWSYTPDGSIAFQPELKPGLVAPLPGLPTLKSAPIRSLWRRRLGVDVFGIKSRYKTACLEHSSAMPSLPSLDVLGTSLIGTAIWINYPHLTEAFVTAVSNESMTMRGKDSKPRRWSKKEAMEWVVKRQNVVSEYEKGQGFTGTGGLIISENQDVILSVRPFQRLRSMPGGETVKTYSKFELEVPIVATLWAPLKPDSRLSGMPALLEKDPFKYASAPREVSIQSGNKQNKIRQKEKETEQMPYPSLTADGASTVEDATEISGEKTHYSSPLGDFSQSLTHSMSNSGKQVLNGSSRKVKKYNKEAGEKKSGNSSETDDVLPLKPSHYDAWLPLDGEGKSLVEPVKLLPTDVSGAAEPQQNQTLSHQPKVVKATNKKWWDQPVYHDSSSRSFATLARSRNIECDKSGRNISVRRAGRKLAGAPRGRLFSVGVAAAAILYGSSGSKAENPLGLVADSASSRRTANHSPMHQENIFGVRGGGTLFPYGSDSDEDYHSNGSPPALEFAHGTTTLSFVFRGGVIVAVDSRASLGNFVGSKTVQKVLPINSHILGTMAGGAADCSILMRKLMAEAQLHELREGRRMSTARVSRMLSNILYANRGLGLSVGTMILGFDDSASHEADTAADPPKIFYVDNSGVRIPGDMFAAGSGSTFALAILDTERRYDMTEEEAIALGIKAIRHATFRDAFSGGYINVYLITRAGWKKVFTEDVAVTSEKMQRDQHT